LYIGQSLGSPETLVNGSGGFGFVAFGPAPTVAIAKRRMVSNQARCRIVVVLQSVWRHFASSASSRWLNVAGKLLHRTESEFYPTNIDGIYSKAL
jgi:hypothetical protein